MKQIFTGNGQITPYKPWSEERKRAERLRRQHAKQRQKRLWRKAGYKTAKLPAWAKELVKQIPPRLTEDEQKRFVAGAIAYYEHKPIPQIPHRLRKKKPLDPLWVEGWYIAREIIGPLPQLTVEQVLGLDPKDVDGLWRAKPD